MSIISHVERHATVAAHVIFHLRKMRRAKRQPENEFQLKRLVPRTCRNDVRHRSDLRTAAATTIWNARVMRRRWNSTCDSSLVGSRAAVIVRHKKPLALSSWVVLANVSMAPSVTMVLPQTGSRSLRSAGFPLADIEHQHTSRWKRSGEGREHCLACICTDTVVENAGA